MPATETTPSGIPSPTRRVLFGLFFFSGFCGLLYQIVWVRLAFASFGVITPVLSVVISVFMLGLSLGSWLGGKTIAPLTRRSRRSAIIFYALAEILIGVGAFSVPALFKLGETLLFPLGEMSSSGYLFLSGIFITLALLPWCIAMGFTFPFMMAFVKEVEGSQKTSFSFLYLANVLGAVTGTLLTAIVLIEWLGFTQSLALAAFVNFAIALCGLGLSKHHDNPVETAESGGRRLSWKNFDLSFLILFATGFISLSMEVAWTRAFTQVLGTTIYSFAVTLATYLFATFVGSQVYRRHLHHRTLCSSQVLLGLCFVSAFFPVILVDPRLSPTWIHVSTSLFPFCGILGYLTPKLIDEVSHGHPKSAGTAYAVNIIGGILGPLFAGYYLIPAVGVRMALIFLAAPFLFFHLYYWSKRLLSPWARWGAGLTGASLATVSIFFSASYEDPQFYNQKAQILRDHTATVIAHGEGLERQLLVNGIGMTRLTSVTKMMAHLPLAFCGEKPESALVVAFGMGTTYRSLLSWGVEATAVELVPSVIKSFPYFYKDAAEIMNHPKGRVVVDDGRRYLRRTRQKFDVITIDPPPPIEVAGSSLLYSKEFYRIVLASLKPGGFFQQWFPGGEKRILHAVLRSLVDVFPYVRAYKSVEGWGFHLLASTAPFETPSLQTVMSRLPKQAQEDLMELPSEPDPQATVGSVLKKELRVGDLLDLGDDHLYIADDHPYNEYFLIRRIADMWWKDGWVTIK